MAFTRELNLARKWTAGCIPTFMDLFFNGKIRIVTVKGDATAATNLGLAVSDEIVAAAMRDSKRVLTEERGGTAVHGENNMFVLDPDDGSHDTLEGQLRNPRRSTGACSLAYWKDEPVVGVVRFPLLGIPLISYYANEGGGTYREYKGKREQLRIDAKPTKGIVFVTVKEDAAAQQLMKAIESTGNTPLRVDGAVFKACAVADPWLLYQYLPDAPELPVVGFYSAGVHLHDVAATTRIVWGAGGIATPPENREGKQVWAAANNMDVYRDLMRVR